MKRRNIFLSMNDDSMAKRYHISLSNLLFSFVLVFSLCLSNVCHSAELIADNNMQNRISKSSFPPIIKSLIAEDCYETTCAFGYMVDLDLNNKQDWVILDDCGASGNVCSYIIIVDENVLIDARGIVNISKIGPEVINEHNVVHGSTREWDYLCSFNGSKIQCEKAMNYYAVKLQDEGSHLNFRDNFNVNSDIIGTSFNKACVAISGSGMSTLDNGYHWVHTVFPYDAWVVDKFIKPSDICQEAIEIFVNFIRDIIIPLNDVVSDSEENKYTWITNNMADNVKYIDIQYNEYYEITGKEINQIGKYDAAKVVSNGIYRESFFSVNELYGFSVSEISEKTFEIGIPGIEVGMDIRFTEIDGQWKIVEIEM